MRQPFAPQQLGKYTLLRKIATGGMAEVFLARSSGAAGFQKTVVIKKILPNLSEDAQFVEMFLNEARVASQLNHPNVVSIYELGESEGAYYIVMEYIDGPNLRGLARRSVEGGKQLEVATVVKLISLACEGLQHAHDAVGPEGDPLNLIHRDISPDNILLSRQGAVKVVDFGIAKAANQPHLTKSGMLKGKLSYMPPEQIRGHALDRRADIFALGVCLYELLAGVKPFESTSEVAVMQAILHQPPSPLTDVRPDADPELLAILEKALQKDREQRYASCADFGGDLDAYLMKRRLSVTARDLARLVDELMGPPVPLQFTPAPRSTSGESQLLAAGTGPKVGTPPNFNRNVGTNPGRSRGESLIAPAIDIDAPGELQGKTTTSPPPSELELAPPSRSKGPLFAGLGLLGAVAIGGTALFALHGSAPEAPQVISVPRPVAEAHPAQVKPAEPAPVEVKPAPVQPAPAVAEAKPVEPPKPPESRPVEPPKPAAQPEPPAVTKHAVATKHEKSHARKPEAVAAVATTPAPAPQPVSTAPAPVAPAAPGKIAVRTVPFAEDVILDGKHLGPTPLDPEPSVPAGRHRVVLVRGSERKELEVEVKAGGESTVKHRFDN